MTQEEEWEWKAFCDYPYEIYHPESDNGTAKYRTWKEALFDQKLWNKDCAGHVARRRKDHPNWRKALTSAATSDTRSKPE